MEERPGRVLGVRECVRRAVRERLPSHGVAIAGAGRTYRLLPGEQVEVPAAFLTDLCDLPLGLYELEATISELSLRSTRLSIEI